MRDFGGFTPFSKTPGEGGFAPSPKGPPALKKPPPFPQKAPEGGGCTPSSKGPSALKKTLPSPKKAPEGGEFTPSSKGPSAPKSLLLLHFTLFLYAVVSIFAKYAGLSMAAQEQSQTYLWLGLELLTLVLYTLLWQKTLGRMPLSFAYSNKAVCTLWTCLFGLLFFGETLTLGKAAGILLVLSGVFLVVTDHD